MVLHERLSLILTLDFGTTHTKAAVFEASGLCSGLVFGRSAKVLTNEPPRHEVDARSWLAALADLLAKLGIHEGTQLEAIVVSGNGPTILPVDTDGQPLAAAMTWLDRRAVLEAAEAGNAIGNELDPAYNLPKILWIRRHEPALYERTAHFVSCPEYVAGVLTGEWHTCLPNEGYTRIIWNSDAIKALGLDEGKLPPFLGIGQRAGTVTQKAARQFGLPAGVPVVMGGPDFIASLVGTATVAPGRCCDKGGTSEGINLCTSPGFPDDRRLLVMPHVVAPLLNVSGVLSTTGRAIEWCRDVLTRDDDFDGFFKRVKEVPPGARGLIFLPYLAGERSPHWDPLASGVFAGLRLDHSVSDMARAVVESTAFAIRDILEVMKADGAFIADLRATGMPSRVPLWNQIKADVTAVPVIAGSFPEPELAGCLAIGQVALGYAASLAEAAEAVFRPAAVFEPDAAHRPLYDEMFSIYRELYSRCADLFPRIRQAADPEGYGCRDAILPKEASDA